jgi:thymidylate synthase
MNTIDEQYVALLKDILENGVEKNTRNGKVLSVFGRSIRYKFKDGKFPLLTTKKMHWKSIVTELLWFLRGDTNIKYLVDNDCHIWDGDCFSNYSKNVWRYSNLELLTKEEFIDKIKTNDEFAKVWGDLGPVYGKQWRSWTKKKMYLSTDGSYENIYDEADQTVIDQILMLIFELKTNPDSRRMMISAWNVGELDQMVLPPCHYGFQVYTRELSLEEKCDWLNKNYPMYELGEWTVEKISDSDYLKEVEFEYNVPTRAISLMWNQRSIDTPLGLPYNIASYALLLSIIAKQVNMIPEEVIGNLGDCHIYTNQIEGVKEQLTREPYELPTVKISDRAVTDISEYTLNDIVLENYQSHPIIKMPLSN